MTSKARGISRNDLSRLGPSAQKQISATLGTKLPRKHPEQDFQISVVKNILLPLEQAGLLSYAAFSNGLKRTKVEAWVAKESGQRAGAWDLIIFLPSATGFGLELKVGSSKLSDAQVDFHARLKMFGWESHTAWTVEDVFKILVDYRILNKTLISHHALNEK